MMAKKNVSAIVSGAGWIGSLAGGVVSGLRARGFSDEDIHSLVIDGGNLPIDKMVDVLAGVIHEEQEKKVQGKVLRLISGGNSLCLYACDGSKILADATDVFAYIDPGFKNWNADEPGSEKSETPIEVHELATDATFAQMFGSLNKDVKKMCLSQHQILNFVQKHRGWLRTDGYATFFLFESYGPFFVADVYFRSDGELDVDVYEFDNPRVWHSECRHRVVVPRLA